VPVLLSGVETRSPSAHALPSAPMDRPAQTTDCRMRLGFVSFSFALLGSIPVCPSYEYTRRERERESSHAARRAFRGLENTPPSPFAPSQVS